MSDLHPISYAERVLRFARDLWIYLLLAVLLTTLIASTQHVDDAPRLSALFVGNLVLGVVIGASCELGMQLVFALPALARLSGGRRLALGLPFLLGCALLGAELAHRLLGMLTLDTVRMFPHGAVLAVSVPVTLAMLGLALLRDRSDRERALRRQVERELEASRLSALVTRTEPHFLFNSLNSIAALTAEDPQQAERAVLQLAALFRYVLEGSQSSEVALQAELGFVRAYVGLEELRYGERLKVEIDADPDCLSAMVPPLVLQPLVENALKHGFDARPALRVQLRIARTGERLDICVDDDGPGPGASRHHGAGSAHADLRRRLEIAYGSAASFETSASPLGGFRARLSLPRKGAHEGADRRR